MTSDEETHLRFMLVEPLLMMIKLYMFRWGLNEHGLEIKLMRENMGFGFKILLLIRGELFMRLGFPSTTGGMNPMRD